MPELRKDYLVDEFVVISTERSKRPDQFKQSAQTVSDKSSCPFCAGNEYLLPGIVDERTANGTWSVRVVPNKYTIVEPKGDPIIRTDNTFFTYAAAYGNHEVIIETPNHQLELEQQEPEQIAAILSMACQRIRQHINEQHIRSVILFKNRGREAGSTLSHSHMQLIAYNGMPPFLKQQLEKFYDYFINKESCPYCEIMHIEKGSYRRISEDEHIISFTPYASRFPFEAWLFPKRHVSSMTQLHDQELLALATNLKRVLLRLDSLGMPPYNIEFLNADVTEPYHFHVRISPRLTYWAGFEFSTETIVNPVSPEAAAAFYREE